MQNSDPRLPREPHGNRGLALVLLGLLFLSVGLSTGCAGLSPSSLPGQEQASVEEKALAAQLQLVQALLPHLGKFANTAMFEPMDPEKPMVVTNARLVVSTVDSRIYDMIGKVMDLSHYKSAPGFWTFANNFVDRALGIAQVVAPWFFTERMMASVTAARGPTSYQVINRGDANLTNMGGGTSGSGWQFAPTVGKPVSSYNPVSGGQ